MPVRGDAECFWMVTCHWEWPVKYEFVEASLREMAAFSRTRIDF